MLSDFLIRQVSKNYGVLIPELGIANRTTFVIDKEGLIRYIEEGAAAIDVTGPAAACSRLAQKGHR
jgi:alkyl hydroperoxide reductase subunit AhpC